MALEPTFPEAAGTVILAIGAAGDWFAEATHEPAEAGQTLAQHLDPFLVRGQFADGELEGPAVARASTGGTWKQLQPPSRDLGSRPLHRSLAIGAKRRCR